MPQDPFAAYVAQGDPFAAYVAEATAPPSAATEGMPEPSTRDTLPAGVEVLGAPLLPPWGQVPGILSRGGSALYKGAQAVVKALARPETNAAIGAVEGGRRGGWSGALLGAAGGYGGTKALGAVADKLMAPNVAKGMSEAGRTATGGRAPLIDALMRGDSADDVIRMAQGGAAPVARAAASQSDDLARELLARDIDWRSVDAVPIDAITRDISRKGGSILEAGESRVGLAERMANALKAGQAQEAERLARALRQRMHITANTTGARR